MLSLSKCSPTLGRMGRGKVLILAPSSTSTTPRTILGFALPQRQTWYPLLKSNANISLIARASSSITKGNTALIGEGTNKNPIQNYGPDEVYLKGSGLKPERMPKHIQFMLDGTRRSCEKNGRELTYAQPFYTSFIMFADLCIKLGIPAVSFAIFATCTWKRTQEEVDLILTQFQATIEANLEKFMRQGMKVSVVGQKWRLSKSLQEAIDKVEEATKNGETIHITYQVSYGARWDMVEAARSISNKVMAGEIEPEDIDEALIQQHLSTRVVSNNFANPDLLIRCGGKRRLSNFYLWQMAHAELYFSNLLLSEFGEAEFLDALRWFQQCRRTFGK